MIAVVVCCLQFRDGEALRFSTVSFPVASGQGTFAGILNLFRAARPEGSFGHSALHVCQDLARKFADLLHFNLSAPGWGLVASFDRHEPSERKFPNVGKAVGEIGNV